MLHKTRMIVWLLAVIGILLLGLFDPGKPMVLAQQPTGSIPTVTGTPEGPIITVYQNYPVIHVYAGPSTFPGAILPIIEVPATPTPFSTPTIDPTLAAAFIGQQTPTRLPTFTPPPPLDRPSFSDVPNTSATNIPAGLLILSLGLFGFFGAVISYLRGR